MTKRIAVIGGAYGEECSYPKSQVFRGSGARAAAVLSSLGAHVTFSTAIGDLKPEFENLAEALGYKLDARPRNTDIWFRYRYPQGRPTMYSRIPHVASLGATVEADLAVVFGMVEGRIPVTAKRVVYDAQDGSKAQTFTANGSYAEDLAIVVSHSEGVALTGKEDPNQIVRVLLSAPGVSVAVVKCGPRGALIKTREARSWIRPFPSSHVHKIGSGDVFTAAFAFAWLIEGHDPITAGWFASRLVASYVETSQDRFKSENVEDLRAEAALAQRRFGNAAARRIPKNPIYLAGPFFHTSQQWLIDEVRDVLRDSGFSVFSPIHDVGKGKAVEVAPADLEGLDRSKLVLALMDGEDAGTIFEVGYALAKGIPVVVVAESVAERSLTMMEGTGCYIARDLTTGIHMACWLMMGDAI